MLKPTTYDPVQRQADKERQRTQDAEDLRSGRVTAEEMRQKNGFFSSLEIIETSIEGQDSFT